MSDTIGYFGIILPDENEFTGAFLTDGVVSDASVRKMLGMATQLGDYPAGNLSAVMIDGVKLGRPDILLTAALAYAKWSECNWFYVVGHLTDDGTYTEVREFEARTVDEARTELEQVPEVLAIRERIAASENTRN